MNSGDLKRRVWADEPVATRNAIGEEITVWTPRGQFWCAIAPVGGQELIRAGQMVADIDAIITARYTAFTASITAKWRLRFVRDGKTLIYNIARPPVEENMGMRRIDFACNTGLNAG